MIDGTTARRVVLLCLATMAWPAQGQTTAPAAPPPAPAALAVLDFDAAGTGKDAPSGPVLADILASTLAGEPGLTVVERADFDKLLAEQRLSLQGLLTAERAASAGKLLGAQLVVMGRAFGAGKGVTLMAKVVGVGTGKVEGCAIALDPNRALSEGLEDLAAQIADLVRRKAADLLPPGQSVPDPTADLRNALGGRQVRLAAVMWSGSMEAKDEAAPAQRQLAATLGRCGVEAVSPGKSDLSDWAAALFGGAPTPWPEAIASAQAALVGSMGTAFVRRLGQVVTVEANVQLALVDRSGKRLWSAGRTAKATDLTVPLASASASSKAATELALEAARYFAGAPARDGRTAPAPASQPETHPASQPATRAAKRTLFAVPFENATGQEQYEPAAKGIGDLLAVMLAQQEGIAVVERYQLEHLTGEQALALKGLTGDAYAMAAGKLLQADTVITGRLFLVDDKLTINAKALEIGSARVIGSNQLSCRPEDLLEIALQLGRSLGKQMALPLPDIDPTRIDASPLASLHFAKALGHYYAGDMDSALMQFMRTIDLDPDYTETLYWSGLCYSKLGEDAHAIIDWERFLKEQPSSPHAGQVKKLLADAQGREKESPVQRLGPTSMPATGPVEKK